MDPLILQIIKKCKKDPAFFINSFCKVKHPKLGTIPFKLFSYQKRCLHEFKNNRFNIFRKCRQCFVEGSMVSTPYGSKKIETIKPGDLIYTLNQQTGSIETVPVFEVYDNGISKQCVEVRTKTGHKSISTNDHKYLTKNGWKESGKLSIGDDLVGIQPNNIVSLAKPVKGEYRVYDLSVPPYHNYIIDGVVVHNCGISTLTGSYALWYAMFRSDQTILIMSKRDDDAKEYLSRNVKFPYSNLPPWMKDLWKPTTINEHTISFTNGSTIRSLTSSPDTLRSNASSLNIIDEAAFIDKMEVVWTGGYSCVNPQTIVSCDNNLVPIGELGDINGGQWQDIDVDIQSDKGIETSDKFYVNGIAETKIITSSLGYEIECTGNHRLKDQDYNWIYARDIKVGQELALKCGSDFNSEFDLKNNEFDCIKLAKRKQLEFLNSGIVTKLTGKDGIWKLENIDLDVNSDGIFYDRVVEVKSSKSMTVDLSVPRNNTYIANGFVSHNTLQMGGSVIVVSCVPKGTYVFSSNGLGTIDKFIDNNVDGAYNIEPYQVLGKDGLRSGDLFYNSGVADTKKLTSRYGEVEGSLNHKLWAFKNGEYNWFKLGDLDIGDYISLQYGQEVWGNNDSIEIEQLESCNPVNIEKTITPELAYFIGLYLAEGSCYLKKNKSKDVIGATYTITCGDDISHVFDNLGLHYYRRKDELHYNVSSKNLFLILDSLGINHNNTASKKVISQRLLQCSKNIIKHILMGLFDGDGGSRSDRGTIKYTTTSKELDLQIRLLLNNMGIVSSKYVRTAEKANQYLQENPEKCNTNRFNYDTNILELDSYNSNLFYKEIGFGLSRKQINHNIVEYVQEPGDSHDIIPNSLDYAIEMFEAAPFGTWTFKKKCDIFLNPIVSKRTRYKTENLSRKLLLRLFDVCKPYLPEDRIEFFEKILSPTLRWVKINHVDYDKKEVYDFSLPDGDFWAHSVIYNGFLGHQTPKGVGNWYWKTWADAVDNSNDFNPIIVNWWDMDWKLELTDEITGKVSTIAPTEGLRELDDPDEIEKYGPGPHGKTFWSPWLEGEYRNLATKGDDSRFRQEVLAEFVGSGNTVLNRIALNAVEQMGNSEYTAVGAVDYVNPSLGEHDVIDFKNQFWVWKRPYTQKDADRAIADFKKSGKDPRALAPEFAQPHTYVVGADPSSGEADDFCAIQVIDVTTQEQVAELKIKALPKLFARMVDYIGRMYNMAHVVCERTGIGASVVQELNRDLSYPNLYRHSRTTSTLKTKYNQMGFPTTSTSKPLLIKQLLDHIGQDGYLLPSTRLYHELCIFIHLGNGKYGNEAGVGNTDDLVLALCLALIGIQSALMNSGSVMIPLHNIDASGPGGMASVAGIKKPGGNNVIAPIGISSEMYTNKVSSEQELEKFTSQLGGIPVDHGKPPTIKSDSVVNKKNILKKLR